MDGYTMTDIGRVRSTNQDYSFCSCSRIGNLDNLFLVADGMGGHNAGDFASSYVINDMVRFSYGSSLDNPVGILSKAIEHANRGLYEKSMTDVNLNGTGTTLVAATITEDMLYVANIGDSRLYLCGRTFRKVTRDHSLVEELVSLGRLDPDSPEYMNRKHVITRAVGTQPMVEADYFEEHLRPGDLILMCSDGLTGMVTDEEIEQVLRDGLLTVKEKTEKLLMLANAHGGTDNIAVLIVENN